MIRKCQRKEPGKSLKGRRKGRQAGVGRLIRRNWKVGREGRVKLEEVRKDKKEEEEEREEERRRRSKRKVKKEPASD